MITLNAAYGRVYTSQTKLLEAWKGGKDFQIVLPGALGPYCSIRDAESMRSEYGIIRAFLRSGNVTVLVAL
jgi:hypothetical protein